MKPITGQKPLRSSLNSCNMRFITIFISFASALADAVPKARLHRRGSEIIVEASQNVNNHTDFFGEHFRRLITQRRFRVADITTELSNTTEYLVDAFTDGAWAIQKAQGAVLPWETKEVIKLRQAHNGKIQKIIRFMMQDTIHQSFAIMGRGPNIADMLKKQKDANKGFSTEVITKLPSENSELLRGLYQSTESALGKGEEYFKSTPSRLRPSTGNVVDQQMSVVGEVNIGGVRGYISCENWEGICMYSKAQERVGNGGIVDILQALQKDGVVVKKPK
jgi:hypothetical protein